MNSLHSQQSKSKESLWTNIYLWALGLGLFGVWDMTAPGPTLDHRIGWGIVLVCVYIWVVQ
jgi:hypothetical protein